jgi:hypothetical protein
MSFRDEIATFTAAEIVAALDCPRQTAYAWLDGSRMPPEWQQTHWLSVLRSHKRKSKKPNKGKQGDS